MRAFFVAIFFAALAASASASGDLKCDGCKWLTGKVQSYLENDPKVTNFTENLINNDICARFPADVASKCNGLVAAYVPQAITAFETKFLDPTLICTEVTKLCSTTQHFDLPSNRAEGDLECKLCTLASGFIASQLENNATEAKLTADIAQLCTHLPGSFAQLCTQAVNAAGPQIMEKFGEFLGAKGCVDLHLCSADVVEAEAEEFEADVHSGDLKCSVCDLIMNELQSVVENSTKLDTVVENFLQKDLCNNLPASFQALCNATVVQETPAILFAIGQKFLGADDCVKIGVCQNSSMSLQKLTGALECEICSKLVDFAASEFFLNPKAIAFVSTEISDICTAIHIPCDNLAQKVAPKIMETVGGFLANNACKWIHACPKA
jgi:hypothetical protein